MPAMPGTSEVRLGSYLVGSLTNLPGDYNVFAFYDEYRDDPKRPVLSQGLLGTSGEPMRIVPRTHTVAPPFFANLLPEMGSVLRNLVARQYRIGAASDFPFLAALGSDLPGAVVIEGANAPRPGELVLDETAGERPIRFSLAGVQIKFSASMVANRLTIPLSGLGGSWIVKLPTNQYPRLPENEFAVMEFARTVGLQVPRTRLVPLNDIEGLPKNLPALRTDEPQFAYAVERFDRTVDGRRIHYEDLNQVANQQPADKYERRATHWIGRVLAALCPPEDVDEFVRRLVFGLCIGNNDMHLKNWAILYPDGRRARIAPLYDCVCTRQYYPAGDLALTIGGERRFERIDRNAIARMAQAAEISERRSRKIADEVVEAICDAWPAYKTRIDDEALTDAIERQFELVPLLRCAS